jgi:hypothetical protein
MRRARPEGRGRGGRGGLAFALLARFVVTGVLSVPIVLSGIGCSGPSEVTYWVGCSGDPASVCACAAGTAGAGCSNDAAVGVGADSRAAANEASSDARIEADGSGEAADSGALADLEDGATGEASSPPESVT